MLLILLLTWHAFFGLGKSGLFHWDNWCFVSESYPKSHVSSRVSVSSQRRNNLLQTLNHSCFWSVVRRRGTTFAETRCILRDSVKMYWQQPIEIQVACEKSWTVKGRSVSLVSRILFTPWSVLDINGRSVRENHSQQITDQIWNVKTIQNTALCSWFYHLRLIWAWWTCHWQFY